MKMKGNVLFLLSVVCLLLVVLSVNVYAQDERKIRKDEYQVQLEEWQARELAATEKIAVLEADNAELREKINETQSKTDKTWEEIYTMLGTDKAGVDAYHRQLNEIDAEIDRLARLSPEDLFRSQDEVYALEEKIAKARENKISHLTKMEDKLAQMDGKLAAVKAKIPANIYDQYTVVKGDNLWKISKNPDVYNDPMQWIRIYNVNKEQIEDPDLIYADRVFKIARGVARNEYLVSKGDFLHKIAGMSQVFNDPTKWRKLYEENKTIINDPNLIYPYQVLKVSK